MVTGVGGGGHGEQILKALRLAETPYEIVGTDVSPFSAGLQAVDHAYLVPGASDPAYLDVVLGLCRRHGVRALFHGSEPELRVMSRERDRIAAAGVFLPINPAPVIDLCMDKVRTAERLRALGFEVPSFRRVRSADDVSSFSPLPAVLKPSVGGGGTAHVHIVQDVDTLEALTRDLLRSLPDLMVQEYVGLPEDEYTVGVLVDLDGTLLNSIAVRRYILSSLGNRIKIANRSGRSGLGPLLAISSGISQGEIGRFPEVTAAAERIALALGARGPLNLQLRMVNGQALVFEINPRFSGTTSLRAMVGYNEPDVLIRRHVLGENLEPRFAYREGVIARSLAETLLQEDRCRDGRTVLQPSE
jgi:carbamoyl-phosphate synthase large subunit